MELVNKTKGELKVALVEKQEGLRHFRFGLAGSKTRNVKEGKNLRKEIAQIQTRLSELARGT